MRRPVRLGNVSIVQAINMVIEARFADRHAAIEAQQKEEEISRKAAFVSTGDHIRDAEIQENWEPSRQLQKMIDSIFSDAQFLLRQWLCDGHSTAFYYDQKDKIFVGIDAAAWELDATDRAISGGKYYPHGQPMDHRDQDAGAPVRLVRDHIKAVLREGSPTLRLENKPKVGAPETTVLRVLEAMLRAPRHHWDGAKLDSMAVTFGASRATVKKARERVLQQLAKNGVVN